MCALQAGGAKNLSLSDFVIDPPPEEEETEVEVTAEDAREAFGFNPHK